MDQKKTYELIFVDGRYIKFKAQRLLFIKDANTGELNRISADSVEYDDGKILYINPRAVAMIKEVQK